MKILSVLLCAILCDVVVGQVEEGDACTYDDDTIGICKFPTECLPAIENLKKGIHPQVCGFIKAEVLVCCPNIIDSIVNSTKEPHDGLIKLKKKPGEISRAKCKEYAKYSHRAIVSPVLSTKPQHEKIYGCHVNAEILTIGSHLASKKEYPHMAQIGSWSNITNESIYYCGGTLISENFVLTDAYCINDKSYEGPPELVRLGVTDTFIGYEHRQEIKIAQHYSHPKYTGLYHDIGLLKLEHPAEINEFVRPACLNTARDINYRTGVVPIWAIKDLAGEIGDDLLKSIVDIVPHKLCNDTYKSVFNKDRFNNGIVEDFMICAATTSDQHVSPCEGIPASPLQERIHNSEELQCMSLIIGIASFDKPCYGKVGDPEVYTRVSAHIDWIEEIVWPELL